uniref:Neuronal acetylcholine receptor subunit alpha-7-like n=1 Tax=Diabrotica virgifera virgifera TaxID=50390 RepID=A0A6P7FFT7_DIAVI
MTSERTSKARPRNQRRGSTRKPGIKPCEGDENEARLMRYLMTDYDAAVRPAQNSSLPLSVIFGISLHHIIDVDEKNQILTTNCWITQIWVDHHLRWNVSDFAGIKVIRIPYTRVWRPDLILYNK